MEKFKAEIERIAENCRAEVLQKTEERNRAVREYQGERLAAEVKKIDESIMSIKRAACEQIDTAAAQAKDRAQGKRLDGKELTPDFALLDAERVKLTQEEFDEIALRNQGNKAMNAALRTYAEKTKLFYGAGFDTATTVKMIERMAKAAGACAFSGRAFRADDVEKVGGGVVM